MDELNNLLSFRWFGSKKGRYTTDKWSDDKNVRPLSESKATANALLTGRRQLDSTGRFKLIAVDLDNKDNWQEVVETYKELVLPQSLTVLTPSGGYHVFFWVNRSIPVQSINDDRHCRNFELKGDNNNITAPGSVFDCGASYRVVRDVPIAVLRNLPAQRLCKHKQEWRPPAMPDDWLPDASSVEQLAKQFDPRAKQTPRGWYFRCVKHEDRQASAALFNSGWYFCSGCGYKELMIKKEKSNG